MVKPAAKPARPVVRIGDNVDYFDEKFVQSSLYINGTGPYAAIVSHVQGDGDKNVSANLVVFIAHGIFHFDEVPMNRREPDTRFFTIRSE